MFIIFHCQVFIEKNHTNADTAANWEDMVFTKWNYDI